MPYRNQDILSFIPGMNFREAAAEISRCGFIADGNSFEKDGNVSQRYRDHLIFGETASSVLLEVAEGDGGHITLSWYYTDSGVVSERETALLGNLKKTVSSLYGDPELKKAVYPYYYWKTDDGFFIMTSVSGLIMISEKHSK